MSEVLHARVKNRRLVLDVPTDLPEGEVVSLQVVEDADDDGLSTAQREALRRSRQRGIAQLHAGEGIDGAEFLAKIRRSHG